MKTVYLLRHAKSSWDQPHLTDSLRPLAPRGLKAAPRVGAYMARNSLIPDRVLCSTARRAVETWDFVSTHMGSSIQVEIREDLDHASPESLLAILQELPDSEEAVLLVGHNPTFGELAFALAGSGREESLEELGRKYPTGGLAILDFPVVSWSELRVGKGFLRGFIHPRALKP